jgi:hypothetical protein
MAGSYRWGDGASKCDDSHFGVFLFLSFPVDDETPFKVVFYISSYNSTQGQKGA